jgi:hypothetical protein
MMNTVAVGGFYAAIVDNFDSAVAVRRRRLLRLRTLWRNRDWRNLSYYLSRIAVNRATLGAIALIWSH